MLLSAVPMNVGIGSSAAVEIGTLIVPQRLSRPQARRARIARLGQMAENHVVGAPCGIMDQIAVASGREGKLTHILCRPGSIVGEVEIPPGTGFVGINSMVRHSVAGNPYGDIRIGAFMGKKIINELRAKTGRAALDYLTEFRRGGIPVGISAAKSPKQILGSHFLAQYKTHDDPVTKIQPDATTASPVRRVIHRGKRARAEIHRVRCGRPKAATAGARDGWRNDVWRARKLPRQLPALGCRR